VDVEVLATDSATLATMGTTEGIAADPVSGVAASNVSDSSTGSATSMARRCSGGRWIIAGPSWRVAEGRATVNTMPAGASALTWCPIVSLLTDGS
jgi:hypothetical protein